MAKTSRKAAAPGLKLIMTTAALAGTLAGWAGLARKDQAWAQPNTAANDVVQVAPLPTLIPPPSLIITAQGITPGVAAPVLRRVNAPAGSTGFAAAAPAGAAPAPVTVTQSSR